MIGLEITKLEIKQDMKSGLAFREDRLDGHCLNSRRREP